MKFVEEAPIVVTPIPTPSNNPETNNNIIYVIGILMLLGEIALVTQKKQIKE